MSGPQFLCRLRSIAAHRDHFIQRLCVCPVVTLSWKSCIAVFRRRHMHSSECCHYFSYNICSLVLFSAQVSLCPLLVYCDYDTFCVVCLKFISSAQPSYVCVGCVVGIYCKSCHSSWAPWASFTKGRIFRPRHKRNLFDKSYAFVHCVLQKGVSLNIPVTWISELILTQL